MIQDSLFLKLNPWHAGAEPALPTDYVHRRAENRLGDWTDSGRVVVITGPRQSGKSTLMNWWIRHLLGSGRAEGRDLVYLNADYIQLRELISQPVALLDYLGALPRGCPRYLFIDEVQRLPEPGLVLKQLIDLGTGMQLVVSGSVSLSIRSQTREHLAGRKLDLFLPPFSFSEVVAALPDLAELADASVEELRRQWPHRRQRLTALTEKLATLGGYPAVWLGGDESHDRLAELFDTYVRRDIVDFLRVDNPAPFNRLVRLLALQIGSQVNKTSLATDAGVRVREIDRYLSMLTDTHVALIVPPFFSNKRKEIVKSPKVFFLDGGFRDILLGQLGPLAQRPDRGALIENLVVSEIAKQLPLLAQQHFWRTQAGAEVDSVVVQGQRLIAAEVKSGSRAQGPSRGYWSFIRSYEPSQAFLIGRDAFGTSEPGQPLSLPIPVFLLLLERILRFRSLS
jgi:predicted AAA+ superfamily ATPase